jgi:hypothetical protein
LVKNFGLGGRFTSLVTILPASSVAVAAPDVAAADAAAGAEGFAGTTIGRSSFDQDQNNHENRKAEHRKKFHFGSENYLMMHLSS